MGNEGMAATKAHQSDTLARTRLRGGWLLAARGLWLALVVVSVGLFIASIPGRFDQLHTLCSEAPCGPSQISPAGVEILESAGLSLDFYALAWIIPETLSLLFYVPVVLIIFWRRSDDWMALFVSLSLLWYGVFSLPPTAAFEERSMLLASLVKVISTLSEVLSVPLLLLLFPDGRFVPRWSRWLAVPFVAISLIIAFTRESAFGLQYGVLPSMVGLVGGAAAQVYRYRRVSGPIERQQTKWAVLGFALYAGTLLFAIVPLILFPALDPATTVIERPGQLIYMAIVLPFVYVATYALPIFIAISILRYRLWDVDFVINRSLAYGVVTVLLGVAFIGGFFGLRALLDLILNRDMSAASAAVSAGGIALLYLPTRNRLRRFVDRRFYHINVDYYKGDAPTPSPVAGGRTLVTQIGTIQNLEPIGRGGMAEVYRAAHPMLDRLVAIKVLPPSLAKEADFRHRFEREAKVVGALQHPNIVQVYDSGEADGTYYMVLEYVEGDDLGEIMRREAPLALERVTSILSQVASALDYAHGQGLVHRDVKPSNVMLEPVTATGRDRRERAVLMDFGIARILGGNTYLTATGTVGTFDYIAPEQIQASANVNGRADVYALGVMAYQMLTGQLPFQANHPAALLIAHLNQPAPDPRSLRPELSEDISDALLRALRKKPEERFETAGMFVSALI